MKVVVLGAKGLPGVRGSGGVERGVNGVARRLVSAGHEVIVYERAAVFGTRRGDGVIVRSVLLSITKEPRRMVACCS